MNGDFHSQTRELNVNAALPPELDSLRSAALNRISGALSHGRLWLWFYRLPERRIAADSMAGIIFDRNVEGRNRPRGRALLDLCDEALESLTWLSVAINNLVGAYPFANFRSPFPISELLSHECKPSNAVFLPVPSVRECTHD